MKKLIVCIFLVAVSVAGCGTEQVVWGYGEDNGPEQWSTLSSDYELCGSGTMQSPIDIDSSTKEKGEDKLNFNYKVTNFLVEDTGHTLEFVDNSKSDSIEFDGEKYTLDQIHFHNESENTIDGQHYPLEGHLVHSNEQGDTVVVSIMFEIGEENTAIGNNFTKISEDVEFNPQNLLPSSKDYYTFVGSLTTPPCTENVKWIVLEQTMTISQEQLNNFTEYYANNNRQTQDLNGREVVYD